MTVRIDIDPRLYAEIARSLNGDPRSRFRVGETVCLCEKGSERELHLYLGAVHKINKAGGELGEFDIAVLPYDARWNRLWTHALKELPLFRTWLWDLMSKVNFEIDDELVSIRAHPPLKKRQ